MNHVLLRHICQDTKVLKMKCREKVFAVCCMQRNLFFWPAGCSEPVYFATGGISLVYNQYKGMVALFIRSCAVV